MLAKSTLMLAAVAMGASAQNMTAPTYNVTFLQGLAQFLGTMNLTSLATAVTMSINSTGTINLLNNINGTAKTLLAPTNAAFTGFTNLYPNSSNPEFVGDVLNYHLLSGSFPGSSFAMDPNHTVARTYLNDSAVVQLEGNKAQAMVFSVQGGKTRVLNQNTNVTITNTTSYQNLLIQIVDAVIDLPGNISVALAEWNLTAASTVFTGLNLTDSVKYAKGITLFVPNDAAFGAANATIAQLVATNITQVQQVLANHIINGTTVYSTLLGSGATSIGGQSFSFAHNASGAFVTSGNSSAKIVTADILLDNGVMHIIDTVLFNNATNTAAASSAYSSATAAAATQTAQQTGAIGTTGGSGGSGSSSGGNSSSTHKSAAGKAVPIFTGVNAVQAVVVLAGVFAGAAVLI